MTFEMATAVDFGIISDQETMRWYIFDIYHDLFSDDNAIPVVWHY